MREQIELVVSLPDEVNEIRLDLYLYLELQKYEHLNLSRSRIQKLIEDAQVLIGDKKAKPSQRLWGNEKLQIIIPQAEECPLKAEAIELDLVYEDNELIVINKRSGMVVHPGAGVHDGTLVNALLAHCQGNLSGICGSLRPGIVHRLDKDTSGLMVVAKSDLAQQSLSQQIKERQVKKVYLALVEGQPPDSGEINQAIGRHPKDRKKMAIRQDGRQALTQYEVLKRWDKVALLKAVIKTGRTHQIRVHMASLNCPVLGDLLYNKKRYGTEASRLKLGLSGHALHATYLAFRHPATDELLEFEAKLPADFQNLLDKL